MLGAGPFALKIQGILGVVVVHGSQPWTAGGHLGLLGQDRKPRRTARATEEGHLGRLRRPSETQAQTGCERARCYRQGLQMQGRGAALKLSHLPAQR